MEDKMVRWVIFNHANKKFLESIAERPHNSVRYSWTDDPSMILYYEKEITEKPINCKIMKVELQQFYRIVRKDLFPEIVETGFQHIPGENEYPSKEVAVKTAIEENKEKIKEYRNLAKALTDWNNQHK